MNNKLREIFGPNFNLAEIDFAPPPSSLSILNVESLDSDRLFKALKSELELYYLERKRAADRRTLHKTKSHEWKEHFYHALQALLNEVLFTTSFQMKQVLLAKIHKWYIEKTGISPIPEVKRYRNPDTSDQASSGIYIPQRIESTVPVEKIPITPYVPSKLKELPEDYASRQNLFQQLLISEETSSASINLPKVKIPRNKDNFFRPYSPSKSGSNDDSFIVKDFRGSTRARSTGLSRGQSPDTFRYTAYASQFAADSNGPSNFSLVPNLRRIQIKEVMKIKKRMASKQLNCPVKVLEGGLVISDFTLDPVSPERLPRGGERLMQDPNEKKGGKKKRKKGKKKT